MSEPARARQALSARLRRTRFRARIRWQYRGRRRVGSLTWLAHRLPWSWWCRLCASDAEAAVREIARRSERPLRFVQIGSNDGRVNDPLSDTIRSHGWTGLLVEPLPHLFEQLVANYEAVPGLRFANVAIGGAEGRSPIYTVRRRPGDPEWVEQIASLDRDIVRRHAYALPDLESRIDSVEVECLPLPTLVARYALGAIDLLHIDAEGLDDEIIRQIPLDAPWAPRYLIFETKHMEGDRFQRIRERLGRGGYRFANLWPDALAYRAPPRPEHGARTGIR